MKTRNNRDHATRHAIHAFTLIELLVVIAIIGLLVPLLAPALSKSRLSAGLARSLSNVRQINVAFDAYRFENKDALPIPYKFTPAPSTAYSAAPHLIGGGFCRKPSFVGSLLDYWPGERLLNAFTNPSVSLPHPKDVNPNWVDGASRADPGDLRASFDLSNWRSPGDKTYRGGGLVDPSMSNYDAVGTSYYTNVYWMQAASFIFTGNSQSGAGLRRAAQWGQKNYNNVNSAKFVIISDPTEGQMTQIPVPVGNPPCFNGEFGGSNMTVMGFADGHAKYTEMKRFPASAFFNAQYGFGSLVYPGCEYSFNIDDPKPR